MANWIHRNTNWNNNYNIGKIIISLYVNFDTFMWCRTCFIGNCLSDDIGE